MPKARTSSIWQHYDDTNQKGTSKCRHCSSTLSNGDGTKTLWDHLRLKHPADCPSTQQKRPSESLTQQVNLLAI